MMDKNRFLWLVAHQFGNDLLPEEEAELKELISKDPEWKEEYDTLCRFWRTTGELPPLTDVDEAYNQIIPHLHLRKEEPIKIRPVNKSGRIKVISFAAILLLLISFAGIALFSLASHKQKSPNDIKWSYLSTNHSQKADLTLPDGTKIRLNINSTLRYPISFTGKCYKVFLIGEATFDVKHDSSRQFQVITRNMIVKDIGTQFDIRAYPNNQIEEATLIHGSIEVLVKDTKIKKTMDRPNETAIVKNAHDIDSVNHIYGGPKITSIRHPSLITIVQKRQKEKIDSLLMDNHTGQSPKQMVFNNEDFASLAQQLEIRYGVVIQINDEKVKHYRFTGIFTHENLQEALKALQLTEKFTYTIHGNFVMIN